MCYNGINEDMAMKAMKVGNRHEKKISKLIPTLNPMNDSSEEITSNLKAIKQKLKEYIED